MESLYLLIPLSAGLVLLVLAVFGWALQRGQFEDLEREGERILQTDQVHLDAGQVPPPAAQQESTDRVNAPK
jgi:cbb3-type cytochrome oxidase maturation protein